MYMARGGGEIEIDATQASLEKACGPNLRVSRLEEGGGGEGKEEEEEDEEEEEEEETMPPQVNMKVRRSLPTHPPTHLPI